MCEKTLHSNICLVYSNGMRTILHSDLNNFYASVESLFHPEFSNVPLVVCGKAEDRHGIVLAKNMIAKKAGVKTGMVLFEAKKLCPNLVCIEAHHDLYLKYSRAVRKIYLEYTDQVEPFGIDEAWLDVSSSTIHGGDGYKIAEEIRKRVKEEIGLTVSIGVSFNKVFAKLGSDMKKPDAVTVISKDNFKNKVWGLPASDILYVGKATKEKLEKLNIHTIGELATFSKPILVSKLGKWGEVLLSYARGQDVDPVRKYDEFEELKSIGNSITYYRDIKTDEDVFSLLILIAESVCARMKHAGFKCARTLSLVVTNDKLETTVRMTKPATPMTLSSEIAQTAFDLFKKTFSWSSALVRMLGITVSDFTEHKQLALFEDEKKKDKLVKLENVIEQMREKYGRKIINKAVIFKDEHMLNLNIKGDPSALSSDVASLSPLDTATYHKK